MLPVLAGTQWTPWFGCVLFVLFLYMFALFFFSVYLDFWFWFCYFSSWEREERKNIKLGGQGGNGESREGKVWLKCIVWKNLLKILKKMYPSLCFLLTFRIPGFPVGIFVTPGVLGYQESKALFFAAAYSALKLAGGPPHLSPQTRSKGRRWSECPRGNDWVRFYIPPAPEL